MIRKELIETKAKQIYTPSDKDDMDCKLRANEQVNAFIYGAQFADNTNPFETDWKDLKREIYNKCIELEESPYRKALDDVYHLMDVFDTVRYKAHFREE